MVPKPKKRKNEKGFTLVELLIALTIFLGMIGIVMGYMRYTYSETKSKSAKLIEQGRQLVQACERYYADHGSWPNNLDDLVPSYLKAVPPGNWSIGTQDNLNHHVTVFGDSDTDDLCVIFSDLDDYCYSCCNYISNLPDYNRLFTNPGEAIDSGCGANMALAFVLEPDHG